MNTANGLQGASVNPFINTFKSGGALSNISFTNSTILSENNTGVPMIGDIDGDGKPDLVFVESNISNFGFAVSLNTTKTTDTITFALISTKIAIGGGAQIKSMVLADIDGDGKMDVVVNYLDDKEDVAVFRNTSTVGKISFDPEYDIPFLAVNFAIGDLNGDGKPDIVALGSNTGLPTPNNPAYIFPNNSTPGHISFSSPNIFGTSGGGPMSITDIDGDGKPDLIVGLVNTTGNSNENELTVFRNISANGGFAFLGGVTFVTGGLTANLKVGDLDGDGKPDLVTSDVFQAKDIYILKNNSTPGKIAFNSYLDYPSNENSFITLGDLNGDGKPDLLATGSAGNAISIYQNNSTAGTII